MKRKLYLDAKNCEKFGFLSSPLTNFFDEKII